MTIKFIDTGFKAFTRDRKIISTLRLEVGFIGAAGESLYPDSTINISSVALIQEFGTKDIPQRSFMRTSMFDNQVAIEKIFAIELSKVFFKGKDPINAFSDIGDSVSSIMKAKAKNAKSWAKPLAESTIQNKGHSTPLLDSSKMIDSIGWSVLQNGSIVSFGLAKK